MAEAPDHGESPSGGPLLGPAVSVKNLQLPFGVLAPNVWGKLKEQPVLVTVVLHLNQGFASAASKDALDENTIHYGELAKQIRAVCTANQTILDILSNVEGVVGEMGKRKDGSFRVSLAAIDINLLKASVFGQMVTVARELRYDNFGQVETSQMSFTVQDTKIMTLIGVNDYERTGPQPVLASLELYMGNGSSSGIAEQHGIDELFNLEHTLANVGLRTLNLSIHPANMQRRSSRTPPSRPSKL